MGKHDKTGDGQGKYDPSKTVRPEQGTKPGKHEGGGKDSGGKGGGKK